MAYVRCPSCSYGIADALFVRTGIAVCQICRKEVRATVLPALTKPPSLTPPPLVVDPPAPGEPACFFNPERRATKVCDHCGVFMSAAWTAKWGSQSVCLKCLDELRTKHKDRRFEAKRTLWDNIALFCATGPWVLAAIFIATFFFYVFAGFCIALTLVTAPAAIFISLRYWNAPRSLVPRGRTRLVFALGLGLLQLGGWVTLGIFLATNYWGTV